MLSVTALRDADVDADFEVLRVVVFVSVRVRVTVALPVLVAVADADVVPVAVPLALREIVRVLDCEMAVSSTEDDAEGVPGNVFVADIDGVMVVVVVALDVSDTVLLSVGDGDIVPLAVSEVDSEDEAVNETDCDADSEAVDEAVGDNDWLLDSDLDTVAVTVVVFEPLTDRVGVSDTERLVVMERLQDGVTVAVAVSELR